MMKIKQLVTVFILVANTYCASEVGKIVTYDPIDLINGIRFDVMAKYIYAKHREQDVESNWALRLYDEHLHVWNNRKERCPEDIFHYHCAKKYFAKNGIESYIVTFHELLDSIKNEGQVSEKSVVPIGKDLALIDGAHRVAACLLYDKKVICEFYSDRNGYDGTAEMLRNKKDFVKSGLSEKYLDDMALNYCQLKKNTYIVTVFPAAVGKQQEIECILRSYGKIIYKKEIFINHERGCVNFMRCLYEGEPFIGDFKNNFHGARLKAPCCYPTGKNGPTRIFLFECDNFNNIRPCKQKIRNIFNIGHDSVHINDTYEETLRIAQAVFNKNSIHFINHAELTKLDNFEKLLSCYKNWIYKNNIDEKCLCIDGSAILSAYGLRDCRDLDVLHHGYDTGIINISNVLIGSHNSEIHYHCTGKDDIIFNPENHFYYRGVKFGSLDILRKMKLKRVEPKDITDVNLIEKVG